MNSIYKSTLKTCWNHTKTIAFLSLTKNHTSSSWDANDDYVAHADAIAIEMTKI